MFQLLYKEIAGDTAEGGRENERAAFERAIRLLKLARQTGAGSREAAEALLFVDRLWSILMEDLAADENGLPDSLKASLISIGIWMLRRVEEIRQGKSGDFTALIEVSETISKGLGRA